MLRMGLVSKTASGVLTVALASLAGCGGGSGSSGSTPVREGLEGIWVVDDEKQQYFNFEENQALVTYTYDSSNQCYVPYRQTVNTDSQTLTLNLPDLKGSFDYTLVDGAQLQLSEQGKVKATLKHSDTLASTFESECGDGANTDIIKANVTFAELPESVQINLADSQDNFGEYSVRVIFDVNQSGSLDEGDLSFNLTHFKVPGSSPETKALHRLTSVLRRQTSSKTSSLLTPIEVSVQGNSIVFSVPVALHSELAVISNGTQTLVRANHWSAQGGTKWDCYPDDCEFAEGLDTSSALADSAEEETSIDSLVDITAVEVNLTN